MDAYQSNGHDTNGLDGRWRRVLAGFERKRVLVVGDLMLDRTAFGQARRISPEAPVPVLTVERESAELGGAGNVARNLAALGARVRLAALVGNDEARGEVHALCGDRAMDESAVVTVAGRPTSVKTRFVAGTQQVLRVDAESDEPLPARVEEELIERLRGDDRLLDAVIISDYAKGVASDAIIAATIELARARGAACVVDPKGLRFERYAGCSAITPNAEEAAAATGLAARSDAECQAAGERLLAAVACEAAVITRGRLGVTLATQNSVWHLPSRAREVFDVTGAGDTLVAVLTLAYASGLTWLESVGLANLAAGLVVQERGASVTTREALLEALITPDGGAPNVVARRRMRAAA